MLLPISDRVAHIPLPCPTLGGLSILVPISDRVAHIPLPCHTPVVMCWAGLGFCGLGPGLEHRQVFFNIPVVQPHIVSPLYYNIHGWGVFFLMPA